MLPGVHRVSPFPFHPAACGGKDPRGSDKIELFAKGQLCVSHWRAGFIHVLHGSGASVAQGRGRNAAALSVNKMNKYKSELAVICALLQSCND